MSKVRVAKPIRFTVFFVLFLVFVLLGVKACNDKKIKDEVAEVEKLLQEDEEITEKSGEGATPDPVETADEDEDQEDLDNKNINELSDFKSVKKDKKPTQSAQKKKVEKEKPKPKKEVKKEKSQQASAKPKESKKKSESSSSKASEVKMRIKVSGERYNLDGISKAKLKGAIKINAQSKKIVAVGFSNPNSKLSPIVKANEIKSTLYRLGLKSSIDVKIKKEEGSGYGEVRFY